MANLTISRVSALPGTIASNTMYLVSNGAGSLDIYVAGSNPTILQHVATQAETLSSVVAFSATAPALTIPQKLWFDTTNLVLNIKTNPGTGDQWSLAMPNAAVPAFAGTGSANTMAHSDHNHNGVYKPAYSITTTAVSKTIANMEHVTVTAATQTITLPLNPAPGYEVAVSVGNFTDTVVARNGSVIMGLAEDMTIDKAYLTVTLRYTDSWRIL